MRGVLISIVLAAGCFQPDPPSGVECSALGECPAGMPCIEGICSEPQGGPDQPPTKVVITIGNQRSQVQDTELWLDAPMQTHGEDDHFSVDETEFGLLRFEFPEELRSYTLERAQLKLRTYDAAAVQLGGTVKVFQVLESWDEDTATWFLRKANEAWSTPGAGGSTHAPDAMAEVVPFAPHSDIVVDLPLDVVRSWIQSPGTNHGMIFKRGSVMEHIHFGTTESPVWSKLILDVIR